MQDKRTRRIEKAAEIAARLILASLAMLAVLVVCIGMINPFAEGPQ